MNAARRRGSGGTRNAGTVVFFTLAVVLGVFGLARRLWVSMRMGDVPGSWDLMTLEWMVGNRTPATTNLAGFFSALAGFWALAALTLLVVGVLSWRSRSFWPALLIAVTAAGSMALTWVLGRVTDRTLPPLVQAIEPGSSANAFAGGPVLNSTAILGVVGYLLFLILRSKRAWVLGLWGLGIFVFSVGWSHIYLGQQWLSDVLVELLIGCAWAAVVMVLHHYVVLKRWRFTSWIRD